MSSSDLEKTFDAEMKNNFSDSYRKIEGWKVNISRGFPIPEKLDIDGKYLPIMGYIYNKYLLSNLKLEIENDMTKIELNPLSKDNLLTLISNYKKLMTYSYDLSSEKIAEKEFRADLLTVLGYYPDNKSSMKKLSFDKFQGTVMQLLLIGKYYDEKVSTSSLKSYKYRDIMNDIIQVMTDRIVNRNANWLEYAGLISLINDQTLHKYEEDYLTRKLWNLVTETGDSKVVNNYFDIVSEIQLKYGNVILPTVVTPTEVNDYFK